jgi:glucose-6-phosphate isomerase
MDARFAGAWDAVQTAADRLADRHLDTLAQAGETLAPLELEGMWWDFSRQHVDRAAWGALIGLARAAELPAWQQRLFAAEAVNLSERRAAVHPALRAGGIGPHAQAIAAMHARIGALAQAMRGRTLRGADGTPLTEVVHVGIGGSRWGPALATEALADYADPEVRIHYIAGLDPLPLRRLLATLDPRRVLVLVASKSFTTAETTHHREALRDWLAARLSPGAAQAQMYALTARPDQAVAAGIAAERVIAFPEAVGGRYSLWSAVGLPVALALGAEHWQALLEGAAAADAHFLDQPEETNLPLRLGLLDVWYASFRGAAARALLPYEQRLALLPAYLQQLYMESCGKSVDRDDAPVRWPTAPVIFGGDGNEAEHTFMQALHQGTQAVPAEFLVCASPDADYPRHRRRLLAQCLGQAEALAHGTPPGTPAHAACAGNRPSIVTLLPRLTPRVLGALLATYEHRVFTAATVWRINPFDQWGVELGKRLAGPIEAALGADAPALAGLHPALRALVERATADLDR